MAAELTKKEKITILSSEIITFHKGQVAFNIGETAKIIGVTRKYVGYDFNERGILATQIGKAKYYTAVDIAEYLYMARISPVQICQKGT